MKILHIINNLQGGGAEKLVSELVPIQNSTNSVSLLLLNNNNSVYYKYLLGLGVEIEILSSKFFVLSHLLGIRNYTKSNEFDIIHVHLFPSLYYVAIATIGKKQTLIYTEHSTSNRRRRYRSIKYIERYIYSQYSLIICISEQTKINLQLHLDSDKFDNRIVCIHNGIVLPTKSIVARELKLSKSKVNLIMIGRFESPKDHATVIQALKLLDNSVNLYFAGNGSLMNECEILVKQLDLSKRVHFLGFVDNLGELLKNIDIAVLSSNWEGFGLAALETMALGIPTVGSDVPGLSEVLENGGIQFKRGNEKDLANKIGNLICDTSFYNTISTKGINKSKIYDIYKMVNEYKIVYENAKKNSYTS